jgi:hypothetical protein
LNLWDFLAFSVRCDLPHLAKSNGHGLFLAFCRAFRRDDGAAAIAGRPCLG